MVACETRVPLNGEVDQFSAGYGLWDVPRRVWASLHFRYLLA